MNQILLELFCLKKADEYIDNPLPSFCQNNKDTPSYNCLVNGCKYLDFTTCENMFCYVGNNSDLVYGISFGGKMISKSNCESTLKKKWETISVKKIDEAYDEYMSTFNSNTDESSSK